MNRDEALKLKAELSRELFPPPQLPVERVLPARMRGRGHVFAERALEPLPFDAVLPLRRAAAARVVRPTLALGVAAEDHGHRLVALVQAEGPATEAKLARLRREVGDIAVERIGRVVKQSVTGPWPRGRTRPLRIGNSISGTAADDAGTLGCFVRRRDGSMDLLSNNHVLAGENAGRIGDPVLQPGTRDSGTAPADVVGTLSGFVPLHTFEPNLVDCAVAAVASGCNTDPRQLSDGTLQGLAADGDAAGKEVEKLGRTSRATRGRVTVIELDNVIAGYDMGDLRFDGVMQIESSGASPFSRIGDSGSLVYTTEGHLAVGLLFAAAPAGGELGAGRSFACPLSAALKALDATLVH